eukprot:6388551-Lingulodinium_polyedra.AAC.1
MKPSRAFWTECSLDTCLAISGLIQSSCNLARYIIEELHYCLQDFKGTTWVSAFNPRWAAGAC